MLGKYPFRKWLRDAAGQHPGVPGSGKAGNPGGAGEGAQTREPSPRTFRGEGQVRTSLREGLGGEERREAGESRHSSCANERDVHERGRELKKEVKK